MNIKQTLGIFALAILMSSCATIINDPYKEITVYTTKPSKVIYNGYTIETVDNKADFLVERKNEPINFTATTDSLTKTFQVKPQNSFMYWSNLFCNFGIGMLVDRENRKHYSYPRRIYINSADTTGKYYRYSQSNNKGKLYLHLSLPYINSFLMKLEKEKIENTGFIGFAIGLDYYYSKNKFINLRYSGVSAFNWPFIGLPHSELLMTSEYISLSNNHNFKRFTFGYGLSYAINYWNYGRFVFSPWNRSDLEGNIALGLVFPIYFQLGEYFNIGVVYRPTFYRPNETKFLYEYLISVDFAWKIKLFDKRKR